MEPERVVSAFVVGAVFPLAARGAPPLSAMATYAEGFRHAHGCPHGEVEDGLAGGKPTREGVDEFEWDSEGDAENAFSGGSGGRAARKVCQDRRCCTWFDLANWFGFLPLELPLADFEACFTDVASGGIGCDDCTTCFCCCCGCCCCLRGEAPTWGFGERLKKQRSSCAAPVSADCTRSLLCWAGKRFP